MLVEGGNGGCRFMPGVRMASDALTNVIDLRRCADNPQRGVGNLGIPRTAARSSQCYVNLGQSPTRAQVCKCAHVQALAWLPDDGVQSGCGTVGILFDTGVRFRIRIFGLINSVTVNNTHRIY